MDTNLSKTLSYLLRHNPSEAGLNPDEQGFVQLDHLVDGLQDRGWDQLSEEQLVELIRDPEVDRFEIRGTMVRATYGHSIDVEPDYPEISPPDRLFHGTSRSAWESIREEGIKPMNRTYVHLSRTLEEAERVGRRHDSHPVILRVSPHENTDRVFYRAGPVVLTDYVPSEWLQIYES